MQPEIAQFLSALDETQYLAPDRMRTYRRRLLEVLLRHARSETTFYADRLSPVFRPDETIDWDRWHEIPILTRADAQENADTLKARELPRPAGRAFESHTSGSTGRAFQHYSTGIQRVANACSHERYYRWHNLDLGSLTAVILVQRHPDETYPAGHHFTGWRVGSEDSPAAALSVRTPVHQQVEWLRRVKPRQLLTYPNNLRELGRVASEDGQPLKFDALLTVGEMTPDDTRDEIESRFGHSPIDRYGSMEVGAIAAVCPHSWKHHISAELVLIEIVDDEGKLVEPGVEGRIIATPFYNLAMPLIRYAIGDHGILSPEPCGCGRTLPTFDRILGRSRNVFRFRDGTRVWPNMQSWEMQRSVPHRQFQVAQVALDRVEFRYVPVEPNQTNDLPGLTAYMQANLHASVSVETVAVDEIKRSPAGKYEDYICLIG